MQHPENANSDKRETADGVDRKYDGFVAGDRLLVRLQSTDHLVAIGKGTRLNELILRHRKELAVVDVRQAAEQESKAVDHKDVKDSEHPGVVLLLGQLRVFLLNLLELL